MSTPDLAPQPVAPVVFLDTETDGTYDARRPWEVGMIRRAPGQPEQEMQFFVDIDLDQTPDLFGLRVGGFFERHPVGRWMSDPAAPLRRPIPKAWEWADVIGPGELVAPGRAALEVSRWTHGAHVIGAVPDFDTETLRPRLRSVGLLPGWHYHLIDIEAMVVGYLLGRGTDPGEVALPWSSDDLSRAIGVEPAPEEERHTALGDARWVARMWDAMHGGLDHPAPTPPADLPADHICDLPAPQVRGETYTCRCGRSYTAIGTPGRQMGWLDTTPTRAGEES